MFAYSRLPMNFWSKVRADESGCWLWTAALHATGYGKFGVWKIRRTVGAHRYAYEHLIGPVPAGLQLDHLCRVRHCINPLHLEPVTHRENGLRGVGIHAQEARQTHCVHGHEFTEKNTYRWRGHRGCKECKRQRTREWIARNPEYIKATNAAGYQRRKAAALAASGGAE